MRWKIIGHTDDHVTVEFEDGHRLNFNAFPLVQHTVAPRDLAHLNEPFAKIGKGMRMVPAFGFDKGGELPAHSHDEASLHVIEVLKGTVRIHKDSGTVDAEVGDVIDLAVGENHSVEGLADGISVTAHWPKGRKT